MASNSIYQNGNHSNSKIPTTNATQMSSNGNNGNINSTGSLQRSSSSQFTKANNGNTKMDQSLPNGYRMQPNKIPTKAEIDYHLENFIMSRKIALNGGNEIRIDDKNISLHLNNPFVTAAYAQQVQAQKLLMQQQQQQQNLHFSEKISETTLPNDQPNRPKRPHSIAVSSPINLQTSSINNDLNAATFSRRQMITTPNIVSGGMMNKITTTSAGEQQQQQQKFCSPINFAQFNHPMNGSSPSQRFRSMKNEFTLYTPPSPVAPGVNNVDVQQQQQQQQKPPNVPQRRSQSIPRQALSQQFNAAGSAPISGAQTLNRPRSLDRYSSNVGMRTTNSHSSSPHNQHIGAMKQSITFHGQQMLSQACYQSDIYEEVGHLKQQQQQLQQQIGNKKADRPMSFAYGTVPEQVYLENQLRIYSEQLKNITESMKKYQEQTRILNELKRQQSLDRPHPKTSSVPMSKSDSKLSSNLKLNVMSSTTSINTLTDEDQTPSHQLRLFLDNIRSSIKEPSFDDVSDLEADNDCNINSSKIDEKITTTTVNHHPPIKPNNVETVKTPSDQLRLFLDAIRHNQNIETHQRNDVPKTIPEVGEENFEKRKSETFSQVTDNIKLLNQDLESFSDKHLNITNISKNMDKILDDFNRMASMLKSSNSVEYLQKCSEALKQTTEQIRQLNGGNNYSSDDSSCSTTPGSIREAVQSLLAQPRNGFQIMDDRMSIFIDIMEQQGKFSQVIKMRNIDKTFFFFCSCYIVKRCLFYMTCKHNSYINICYWGFL
ncbi:dystrophin-like [Chironomus tepperi]|uniref:dystrophin-like n=1 Tax=Chironomus tepperi TaxID=113505 RepID=UPI00391F5F70